MHILISILFGNRSEEWKMQHQNLKGHWDGERWLLKVKWCIKKQEILIRNKKSMTLNAGQSPHRSKRHLNQQKCGYTEYTVAWTCDQWQNFREKGNKRVTYT